MVSDKSGWENSCPLIDYVISFIKDNTCCNNKNEAKECIRKLKRVKEINDGIRMWGNAQLHLLDDAKMEIGHLERVISDMKYDLKLW